MYSPIGDIVTSGYVNVPLEQATIQYNSDNTNDFQLQYVSEDDKELDVVESVEIEREFDEQGRVVREKRTVSKPRKIPRDLEPRTPPIIPTNPNKYPWTNPPNTYKPYIRPWDQTVQPPFWIGDPPYSPNQIMCGGTYTPPQGTYTINYN